MQDLNKFETQQECENFIAQKQQMVLDLIRQNAVREGRGVFPEFEVALLGLIAVKPEMLDDETLTRLAGLDITQLPLLGQAHLLKLPVEMNTPESLSTYTIVHELMHQISFRLERRNELNEVERLFEEGVVDNAALDVINSPIFSNICAQYGLVPDFIASGYVVERSITGLLDLCFEGEVERSHIIGDEILNQKLNATSVDGLVKGEYVARLADSLLGAPDMRQPLADRYARINEMMSVVLLDEANELLNRSWQQADFVRLVRYKRDFFDAMQLNLDSAKNLDANATADMLEQLKACQNVFDTLAYRHGFSRFDELAASIETPNQNFEQQVNIETKKIIEKAADAKNIETKSTKIEK